MPRNDEDLVAEQVLRGAYVFDAVNGGFDRRDILLEGATIKEVSSTISSRGSEVDVADTWVVPGLINAHEHLTMKRTWGPLSVQASLDDAHHMLRGIRASIRSLREGVTTVRDLGAKRGLNVAIRDAIEASAMPGPRVLAAGSPITSTGGHTNRVSSEVDGTVGMRTAVRREIWRGADLIKLISTNDPTDSLFEGQQTHPELFEDEMREAVYTAHSSGRRVACHTMGTRSIRWAIDADVDSIEHGVYLNEELAESMVGAGTALVPTLSGYAESASHEWSRGAAWIARHEALREAHRSSAELAIAAGVKIGVGSDTVGDLVDEMKMLVDCGMTREAVLCASTAGNAAILGISARVGSVEPGKIADLVVLDRDPLQDLENLRSIRLVAHGGRLEEPGAIGLNVGDETEDWNTTGLAAISSTNKRNPENGGQDEARSQSRRWHREANGRPEHRRLDPGW